MSTAYERLDEAMKDLIEAYLEINDKLISAHGDDEDSVAHGLTESLETSIESAIEEHDMETSTMAAMLSNMTDALEQLDPSAFDDDEHEESEESYDTSDVDDVDDEDMDEMEMD